MSEVWEGFKDFFSPDHDLGMLLGAVVMFLGFSAVAVFLVFLIALVVGA